MLTQLRSVYWRSAAAIVLVALAGCPSSRSFSIFVLESGEFIAGGTMPERFAGPLKNDQVSPPLFWSEPPAGTQELALVVTDEAGRTRWTLYGIGSEITLLPEGIPQGPFPSYPPGAKQGMDFNGVSGYQGGILSEEGTMALQFTLYALDAKLNLGADLPLQSLFDAFQGHILGQASLVGRFSASQE